ncbi:hypothetical protein MAR_030876 [Mya arenaria]|uniref:Uncharacterized protein n=1 Tax=Mya arenaria TaxID=6604 RepID=A0ABY7F270_MYAAR|nr:hypothetical protein MAR_030876 [Mya arenaria]
MSEDYKPVDGMFRFYCTFQPPDMSVMYLPGSRVNDGVCDCCDGSDEWGGVKVSSGVHFTGSHPVWRARLPGHYELKMDRGDASRCPLGQTRNTVAYTLVTQIVFTLWTEVLGFSVKTIFLTLGTTVVVNQIAQL